MTLNRPTEFQSLDDLLHATYNDILEGGVSIQSKRGVNLEITHFAATLLNPRIRTSMSLDRKLVKSKFAEFAWYLSADKDKDFIKPYISAYDREEQHNNKILGAYGPKIFGSAEGNQSQFDRIIDQILKRETTKHAYITISDAEDYKFRADQYASPPCTIGLHFYVRDKKLNLATYMRSNDGYLGLPHDLFCFTMLQELVAIRTNSVLGVYTHYATSMHVYETHKQKIQSYLDEGFHEPVEMPCIVDSSASKLALVVQEFDPRMGKSNFSNLDVYWRDFCLFSIKHDNNESDRSSWKNQFSEQNMRLIARNSIAE